jgi:hypothetical protein
VLARLAVAPTTELDLAKLLQWWGLEGLAPALEAAGGPGPRLSELTAEDLADLGVPRAVRAEVLTVLRAAVSKNFEEALRGWMTPLAHTAAGYLGEEHPRLRLWAACDLVEMAMRLVVIIDLAQLRRAYGGRLPRERLARVFEHIRTPTLSHWRAMALETAGALEKEGSEEMPGVGRSVGADRGHAL